MNLAEMVAAVEARLGLDGTDPYLTPQVLKSFVIDALHAYEVEEDWPWLQSTATISAVSGTTAYAVPDDWLRTFDLRLTDTDEGMDERQYGELQDRWDASATGRPEEYAIWADGLVIRPIPDGSYTLRHLYLKAEPTLSGDTDRPLLPQQFHIGLVEYATHLALRRSHEEWRSRAALDDYQACLQRMRDNRRRFNGPLHVKTRPW